MGRRMFLSCSLVLWSLIQAERSQASGNALCAGLSIGSPEEGHLSLNCTTNTIQGSLYLNSIPLFYTASAAVYCNNSDGTEAVSSFDSVIIYEVEKLNINHSLPTGTWCTMVGCYYGIFYSYAIQNTSCVIDEDECTTGTHNCSESAECSDIIGGYNCECWNGYEGNGYNCADIDECSVGTYDCQENAECSNLMGGYQCVCKKGYEKNHYNNCTDIDECSSGAHNCHEMAACSNLIGGYNCTCPGGYIGNGYNCTDEDECSTGSHMCSRNANCSNAAGGYSCDCKEGFEGNGFECLDINECSRETHNCSVAAECFNFIGGYNCTCKPGYYGDGFNCSDEDECSTGSHMCSRNANCSNTAGSYSCDCKEGFEGNGFECLDIDECSGNTSDCQENAECLNLMGGYQCVCKDGYEKNHNNNCTDINECSGKTHNCSVAAECSNFIGGYNCTCRQGYYGDGFNCSATSKDSVALLATTIVAGLGLVITLVALVTVLIFKQSRRSVEITMVGRNNWKTETLQNDYYPFDPSHREMLATSQESIIHPLHHCYDHIVTEDDMHCHFGLDQSHVSSAAMCSAQLNSNNTVSTVDFDLTLSSGMTVEIEGEGDPVTIVMISRDHAVLMREDGVVTNSPGLPNREQHICPSPHVASIQHNIKSNGTCSDYRDLLVPCSPDTNKDIQTAYVSSAGPLEVIHAHPTGCTDSNTDDCEEVGITSIQDDFSCPPQGICHSATDSEISSEYVHTETPL